jgi:hypothetical protein
MSQNQHPKLSPSQVDAALAALVMLPIDEDSKRVLRDILLASSNPDGERADVVIATLESERQTQIVSLIDQIGEQSSANIARGAAALQDLSEAEWERLVNG